MYLSASRNFLTVSGIGVLMLIGACPTSWNCGFQCVALAQEPETKPDQPDQNDLSVSDQSQLRQVVYGESFRIALGTKGELLGKRLLLVPDFVSKCHQSRRLATLKLLAQIVQGGAPKDALLASTYITALEGDPVFAALDASMPLDKMDQTGKNARDSLRIMLIESAEKAIKVAEKAEEKKLKKNE